MLYRLTVLKKIGKLIGNKAKGRNLKTGVTRKKSTQIFRKTDFPYPLIRTRTCVYQGVRNVRFGKFSVLCFLVTPVLRFALLPYYRGTQRSSYPEVVCNEGVFKKFRKFTGTHLCLVRFFNKITDHQHRTLDNWFPVNFAKFLKATFLQNTSGWLLLKTLRKAFAIELFLIKLHAYRRQVY